MTNKALSIFNQLRPLTVGFDDTFRHFESMFDHQLDHIQTTSTKLDMQQRRHL